MEQEPAGTDPPTPEPDERSPPSFNRLGPARRSPAVSAQRLPARRRGRHRFWAGILVLVSPLDRLWTENPSARRLAQRQVFRNNTFVRGMISGIGLLDLWFKASDAVHCRDLR